MIVTRVYGETELGRPRSQLRESWAKVVEGPARLQSSAR